MYNAPLRTFRVDAGTGTLSQISATARPGDLFELCGTFSGQWLFPSTSGTEDDRITVRSAPGCTATLTVGLYDGGVILDNVSYWVVEGLEITDIPVPVRMGSVLSHHNWIRGNRVHNVDSGIDIRRGASFNRIESNLIEEVGSARNRDGNSGDGIILIDGASDNLIIGNKVGRAGHAAIESTLQSGTAVSTRNVFAFNELANTYSGGFIFSGTDADSLVEANYIHGTGRENAPNIGTRSAINIHGRNAVVHHNYIADTQSYSLLISSYEFAGVKQNCIANNVYNNTFSVGQDAAVGWGVRHGTECRDNRVDNNVFTNHKGRDGADGNMYQVFIDMYSSDSNLWTPEDPKGNVMSGNSFDRRPFAVLVRLGSPNVYWPETAYPTWN